MLGFMDYVQEAWYASTGWDADNSYGALTATARSLLELDAPIGVALHCSSLASRSFANSYSLVNAGAVDGSLAYLYSSRPLLSGPASRGVRAAVQKAEGQVDYTAKSAAAAAEAISGAVGATGESSSSSRAPTPRPRPPLPSRSTDLPLRSVIRGYRALPDTIHEPEPPPPAAATDVAGDTTGTDSRAATAASTPHDALLYGRLYLPQARLEALYLRRLSAGMQLKVACVSSSQLRNGGSALLLLQRDTGAYQTECLYSTDGGLLGVRGLWNFGERWAGDGSIMASAPTSTLASTGESVDEAGENLTPIEKTTTTTTTTRTITAAIPSPPPPNGRFSAGGELYYGALNKTGGMSLGCRFATLPRHRGFPYTMTLTLNPLMGNLSSTYSVRAGPALALATRFDFNVYSYESEYQVGLELWKRRQPGDADSDGTDGVRWAVDKMRESERRGWVSERRVRDAAAASSKLIGGLEPEHAAVAGISKKTAVADEANVSVVTASTSSGAAATTTTATAASAPALADRDVAGVLKARANQQGHLSLLWEGRVKQLLYTLGLNVDFGQREHIFRGVGVEFHYSS